jgi:Protein of unknown function (DUF3987)
LAGFLYHIESQCGPGRDLQPIQDFAAKSAEHAARIAGVLTIVEDHQATEIGAAAMHAALTLADWYVAEAVRLQRAARTDPHLRVAQQLLEWLRERSEEVIDFRAILQRGPTPVRTKDKAEKALEVLKEHGWVVDISLRPRRFRLLREV